MYVYTNINKTPTHIIVCIPYYNCSYKCMKHNDCITTHIIVYILSIYTCIIVCIHVL